MNDSPSKPATPAPVRLEDYRPPDYAVRHVDLGLELDDDRSRVTARLVIESRHDRGAGVRPLVLDGEALELVGVALDGRRLGPPDYHLEPGRLVVPHPPERFTLGIVTEVEPARNTALSGLYRSGAVLCTQCEAEGFRRITWYPDRPDVLATFRVRLEGDRERYPVLLANGNLMRSGRLDGGRHFAEWSDPFPKPSYLFAVVAGRLAMLGDYYVTLSGRRVLLRIYTGPANVDKCTHALDALKAAMRWDEATYGLAYDLELYMIVAVDDFNMGAMENKGLNIFNTALALANPETATDGDYLNVLRVIAHEYFHNWTGNRITLRDWFQLSLKEGLTVFRDQQFMESRFSRAVKRIEDVMLLRETQLPEDAGPLAHAVRPDSYIAIDNFYTRTVYEKGAEVVRMLHTLLGPEAWSRGMRLYVTRHDGRAVTCEDFVDCMAEVSGRDLSQFFRWYRQAGTPLVEARGHWDEAASTYALTLRQSCPPTPGQPTKDPFHIPVAMALLAPEGEELPLQLAEDEAPWGTRRVLELTEAEQTFTFRNVRRRPVPSLLRGFSAPVRLDAGHDEEALAFLLAHDKDPVARFDAGQELAVRVVLRLVEERRQGREPALDGRLPETHARILEDDIEPALKALLLALPGIRVVAQRMATIDIEGLVEIGRLLRRELGRALHGRWLALYRSLADPGAFAFEPRAVGRRRLRSLALARLVQSGDEEAALLAYGQLRGADNMTDRLAGLVPLVESGAPERERALVRFLRRWRHEPLVVDKWFRVQATADRPDALETVRRLLGHELYLPTNPNRVRALLGAFAAANPAGFHRADGAGYALVADQVLDIDSRNPQLAARLLTAFGEWRRYDDGRQALMRARLERIRDHPGLSRDSYEIAARSLGDEP
jgi:aminopeptidase N